jgi:DNA-binding NarL/FixJ family response regulator
MWEKEIPSSPFIDNYKGDLLYQKHNWVCTDGYNNVISNKSEFIQALIKKANLTSRQAKVINLHLEGHNKKSIAKQINRSTRAVYYTFNRAVRRLKDATSINKKRRVDKVHK